MCSAAWATTCAWTVDNHSATCYAAVGAAIFGWFGVYSCVPLSASQIGGFGPSKLHFTLGQFVVCWVQKLHANRNRSHFTHFSRFYAFVKCERISYEINLTWAFLVASWTLAFLHALNVLRCIQMVVWSCFMYQLSSLWFRSTSHTLQWQLRPFFVSIVASNLEKKKCFQSAQSFLSVSRLWLNAPKNPKWVWTERRNRPRVAKSVQLGRLDGRFAQQIVQASLCYTSNFATTTVDYMLATTQKANIDGKHLGYFCNWIHRHAMNMG